MTSISGSRLREARKQKGLSQKALAEDLGLSPAYVNLIESGRRKINPKIMQKLQISLGVNEQELLGADVKDTIQALRLSKMVGADMFGALEKFALEMPKLAQSFLQLEKRAEKAETALQDMQNKLSSDPYLEQSLHDILSVATSIRSSSSILNTQGDMTSEQSAQFQDLLHKDAIHLSEALRALAVHLSQDQTNSYLQDHCAFEFAQYLEDRGFYFEALEAGVLEQMAFLQACQEEGDLSILSRLDVKGFLSRLWLDARALPKEKFLAVAEKTSWDFIEMARVFDRPVEQIMRRVLMLSQYAPWQRTLLFLKDHTGRYLVHSMQFGSIRDTLDCSLWPIFQLYESSEKLHSNTLNIEGKIWHADAVEYKEYKTHPNSSETYIQKWQMMLLRDVRGSNETALEVGIKCERCKISDCVFRRNDAITL